MQIIASIAPIFIVILFGVIGGKRGLIPESFQKPANKLAFNFAFPALLINAIGRTHVSDFWQPVQLAITMGAMLFCWLVSWQLSRVFFKNNESTRPTWIQTSVHGNYGFVGLAVILYALGDPGVAASGLLVGVMSILQNAITVITLSYLAGTKAKPLEQVKAIATNPIIIAILIGLTISFLGIDISGVVGRTLKIMGGMGVPLALLIIGAKLGETRIKAPLPMLALPMLMKLFILPALAWGLLSMFGYSGLLLTTAVLIVASPTATLSVVFADQMGGDSDFASTMVSLTTALSALTFSLWLMVLVP
ncbi:AEC family transporter [Dethiosulfatarculus sandiegensis]|uniref:Transporter n=1 Tax=Dethiosulfatarculus sandiegensis TaxID=1429043 RepID=A0A0D2GE57_9BACT|nr:AEC family transporter [Dethiosulfatarculus sandiegensis]KIX13287.1 hypothetical protein X474_15015 [Dethiosulfatarculus sandiegensis]